MAGTTRMLVFAEGVEVANPFQSSLETTNFAIFASDALFVAAKGSVATVGDAYTNSGDNHIHFYDGTVWRVIEDVKNNYAATIPPAVTDDGALGHDYSIGSKWFDATAKRSYVAVDVTTGAAIWRAVGITDAIADGEVALAPTQNAVFDALALKIATSVLDTDGTLAANSDAKIATQKATKTYADTKIASSFLDTDGTLAANSDSKIATQKATKTFHNAGVFPSTVDITGLATTRAGVSHIAQASDPASTSGTIFNSNGTPRAAGLWDYDTNGSGVNLWLKRRPTSISQATSYVITNTDGVGYVGLTAVSTVITLPQLSANYGRTIVCHKNVSGNGTVTVTPFTGDTIKGLATNGSFALDFFDERVTLFGDIVSNTWQPVSWFIPHPQYTITSSVSGNNTYVSSNAFAQVRKLNPISPIWVMSHSGSGTCAAAASLTLTVAMGVNFSINVPGSAVDYANATSPKYILANAASNTTNEIFLANVTSFGWSFPNTPLSGKPNFVI